MNERFGIGLDGWPAGCGSMKQGISDEKCHERWYDLAAITKTQAIAKQLPRNCQASANGPLREFSMTNRIKLTTAAFLSLAMFTGLGSQADAAQCGAHR